MMNVMNVLKTVFMTLKVERAVCRVIDFPKPQLHVTSALVMKEPWPDGVRTDAGPSLHNLDFDVFFRCCKNRHLIEVYSVST
jgi:hypothetical protein